MTITSAAWPHLQAFWTSAIFTFFLEVEMNNVSTVLSDNSTEVIRNKLHNLTTVINYPYNQNMPIRRHDILRVIIRIKIRKWFGAWTY